LTKQSAHTESHTDLGVANELRDKEFRDQFFRTERELDIPAQVKILRKLRGLNQGQLAEMTGTKQSGISRLERSSHGNWNLETLVKIAEALDARLAVVIEPYELVVARYKAEEKARESSAATADVKGAEMQNAPKDPDVPLRQKLPSNQSDNRPGNAPWN
jgi:transcriptional regulator with XRE-family HTH domain